MEKGINFQLPCSVHYSLQVVQVGSDEADERNTRIAKRNLQALGCLLGQMGTQVVFLIPLVSRDECQKELKTRVVPLWNFGVFNHGLVYMASGMLETDEVYLSNWGKIILALWIDMVG